jgi:hypothetical protein
MAVVLLAWCCAADARTDWLNGPIKMESAKGSGWPQTWTACRLTDPRNLDGRRDYVGNNPWPIIPMGSYVSWVQWGATWYRLAECGGRTTPEGWWADSELCLARGPTPCEQELVAAKTALARNPGDMFRAWSFVAGPEGITGLGGVSCKAYGAPGSCAYPIHRVTAPEPDAPWTLSAGPVAGLSGVSTSGGPMSLVRLPAGTLWFWPTVVFDGRTGFGFARSTDRGATWQGHRTSGGAWIDLRPDWMRADSWVFTRAVLLDGRVHLWATRWRKGWGAGQVHLVSDDGLTFSNANAGRTMEFGTSAIKGMTPFLDAGRLRGVMPLGYGFTAVNGSLAP